MVVCSAYGRHHVIISRHHITSSIGRRHRLSAWGPLYTRSTIPAAHSAHPVAKHAATLRTSAAWCSAQAAARRAADASSCALVCRAVGEGALLLRFGTAIDLEVNKRALDCLAALDAGPALEGVTDMLPAYASLMVHFNPMVVSAAEVKRWCLEAAGRCGDSGTTAEAGAARTVTIPVRYGGADGPDIHAVAQMTGLESAEAVARAHHEGQYRVYFLGFMGGFPYLGGLPESLAAVPRLMTPRQKVPKGAVGIAAGQTGVYTVSSPGGWHLLGATSLSLFDPSRDPPALLRAGDQIQFVQESDGDDGANDDSEVVAPHPTHEWVEVLNPGPQTSVQDIGRPGYSRHGVSPSGAADELAVRMGNALLDNDEDVACLEVTLGGLKLRCLEQCDIALTGADCEAKVARVGRSCPIKVPVNRSMRLECDDVLTLGYASDGARAYVCVKGGVDVPPVLGSRSTDLRAGLPDDGCFCCFENDSGGFCGRALASGDCIGKMNALAGDTSSKQTIATRSAHDPLRDANRCDTRSRIWKLRVLPGAGSPGTANEVDPAELQALVNHEFDVLPRSDRMAVCLSVAEPTDIGDAGGDVASSGDSYGADISVPVLVGGQQLSEPCVSGTIQLPPDGNPLILLAEHQTTGGYKVPGVVIKADLWQVGQMRPGDKIRFVATSVEAATAALRDRLQQAHDIEEVEEDVDISPEDLNLLYLKSMAEVRELAKSWADAHRPEQKEITEAHLPQHSALSVRDRPEDSMDEGTVAAAAGAESISLQLDDTARLFIVSSAGKVVSAWTSRRDADAHAQQLSDADVVECYVDACV